VAKEITSMRSHPTRYPRSSWKWILVTILVLLNPQGSILEAQSSSSSLALEPTSIDLGRVGHGDKRLLEFQIINMTKEPVQITSIRPSCGCMKMRPHDVRTPLGPGERRKFQFDLSLGRGWGAFSKKVEVLIGNLPVVRLPVLANFHPTVRPSSRDLVLSTSTAGPTSGSSQILELTQSGTTAPPTIEKLKSSAPHFKVRLLAPKGNRARIEVTATEGISRGRFVGQIDGLCNGLPFIMPIRGRAFGLVVHQPQSWNLNQVNQSGFAESTLKLRRADGKALKVLDSSLELTRSPTGLDISFAMQSLDDGSVEIRAYIADPFPTTAGGIYGKLNLTLDTGESEPLVVDLLGVIRIRSNR
jgi:hypothetical protein